MDVLPERLAYLVSEKIDYDDGLFFRDTGLEEFH